MTLPDNRMEKSLAHLTRHRELLREEFRFEKEQEAANISGIPVRTRVLRGICRYPLAIERCHYNSLNQYVVVTRMPGGGDIAHQLEYGSPVRFFTEGEDGKSRFLNYACTVSYTDGDITAVAVPDEAAATVLKSKENIGLQLTFDETTYKLMFSALEEVISAKGNRLSELREILLGDAPARQTAVPDSGFQWLNRGQGEAVNRIIKARDVMIVHGPPGTGKTTTLVEAVYETLFRERHVLVCAQSNMAVDWICEKLQERGIPVLRTGNPARVNGSMLASTFEKKFEDHPDYPLLWKIRKEIREMRSSASSGSRHDRDRRHDRIRALQSRESELEHAITSSLLDNSPVIACTLAGSASKILEGRRFSTLFIDEASQALEAASWIAINRADRVIFAGDHYQLPPTVKCLEAQKKGLGTTLMETVAKSKPECVHMLSIQYRCDPGIMNFSSEVFYKGKLTASPSIYARNTSWAGKPVEWIDTGGLGFKERFAAGMAGRMNVKEARLTVRTLHEFMNSLTGGTMPGNTLTIGIISPYRAQVQLLKRMVDSDKSLGPVRNRISVDTIDGFQGQERDVVIISMVRSNDDGNIGFLNELRRMNVAMTRARYKLIIIGDSSTLCRNIFYRVLFRYVEEIV